MKKLWLSLAMSCFVAPAFAEFAEDEFCDVDMMDEAMELSEDDLAAVFSSIFDQLEEDDDLI